MVDVAELERIHAELGKREGEASGGAREVETAVDASTAATAGRQSDIPTVRRRKLAPPPPADNLETVATRPFETPVNALEIRRAHEPSRSVFFGA